LRRLVIAGNWKMYKNNKEAVETLTQLKDLTKDVKNVDIVIGAPFTCLSDAVKTVEGSNIKIAAENVYPKIEGAYTGEISPKMLKDIGVTYVILGHSERREYFKESDEFINQKVKAAEKVIIAYEPVWAIGTGKTATPEMAEETHKAIRNVLAEIFGKDVADKMIIQYGGSMKPENAKDLLSQEDIDGGLVGGASLKADSFFEIIKAGN